MSSDRDAGSEGEAGLQKAKLEDVKAALDKKREAVAANERALRDLTISDDDISTVTIRLRPASSALLGNQTMVALASADIPQIDSDPSDTVSADSDGPVILPAERQ